VFSLVSNDPGKARSHVVTAVTGATLRKVMADHVDIPSTTLHTDGGTQFKTIGKEFLAHESVDHVNNEYVCGDVSTNEAESYFAQLKRSTDGTHTTWRRCSYRGIGRAIDCVCLLPQRHGLQKTPMRGERPVRQDRFTGRSRFGTGARCHRQR
jgi:hypothetical protein